MIGLGPAEEEEVVRGDVARDGGNEEHGGATASKREGPSCGRDGSEEVDGASEFRD